MSDFVDSPMSSEFQKNGSLPTGSPGEYDGHDVGPFGEYTRTKSPNACPEKWLEKAMPKPSGENDQF